MISFDEVKKVVGHRFPGGTVTIEPWRAWLLNDLILSPKMPDGIAHPIWAYMAGMAGQGVSIPELFELMHATAADGPMLGEFALEWHEPLRVGATYNVRGGITGVDRKTGRRAGTFDIQTYTVEILDGDRLVAVSTNSLVYPRGGGEGGASGGPAPVVDEVILPNALPEFVVESVSPAHMKTMAALLVDPNPIHWDTEETRRLGLGDQPVNQGPVSISYVLNMLMGWAGGPERLRSFRVRCLANAYGNDRLRAGGEVLGEKDGSTECHVFLKRADGVGILDGVAVIASR